MVALSLASFSNCSAIRENAISKLPALSPASTILISIDGKISPSPRIASASVFPFSMLVKTCAIDFFNFLFSVCSSSITSASFMATPASKMLTNCRQNTERSRGLSFFPNETATSSCLLCSSKERMTYPSFFKNSLALSLFAASILPRFSFPDLSATI